VHYFHEEIFIIVAKILQKDFTTLCMNNHFHDTKKFSDKQIILKY